MTNDCGDSGKARRLAYKLPFPLRLIYNPHPKGDIT